MQILFLFQTDMIGDSLYNYVYQDDHEELTKALTIDEAIPSITCRQDGNDDESLITYDSLRPTCVDASKLKEQRKNFNVRMALRTSSRRESVQYEYLQVSGILRPAHECKSSDQNSTQFKLRGNS